MRTHNFGVLVAAPTGAVLERTASSGVSLTGGDDSQIDGQSGQDLVDALTRLGHRPILVALPDPDPIGTLRAAGVSACVLATHGSLGGSGAIQGTLALHKIPHTGPGAGEMLAFDKLRARQILGCHSLPVPTTLSLGPDLDPRALSLLGWPAVIKPRRGSLGVGVRFLDDPAAITAAAAERPGGDWLLERAVDGREIQVVLLDGKVLGAMEVEHTTPGQICAMTCPPALSRSRRHGIDHLATRAAAALGLTRGPVRVDILLHERHNEVVLEVEPLPPLHRAGVVAKVALASGVQYDALVAHLIGDPLPARTPARPLVTRAAAPAKPAPVAELHAH